MMRLLSCSLAALLTMTAGGVACADDVLRIGVSTAETPPGNIIHGTEIREGVAIAAQLLNDDGGVLGQPIELVFEDSAGTPERGTTAVERLITESDVTAITGVHHSNVALAEIEVAHRYGIPYINTNAWSASVREVGYPEVFSPSNYSARSAQAMAETIQALEASSVVVFAENTDYGIDQMESLETLLEQVAPDVSVDSVLLDRRAPDYLPALIPLRSNPPDVVLNIMVQPAAYKLINQLHELGIAPSATTVLYDGAGVSDAPDFWDNVSDAGVGMLSFGLFHPDIPLSEWGQRVRDTYAAEHDGQPSRLVFQAADSILVIASATEDAGATGADGLVSSLGATDLQGSTGVIQFNDEQGPLFQQWIQVPYVTYQFTEVGQAIADSTLIGDATRLDASLIMTPDN